MKLSLNISRRVAFLVILMLISVNFWQVRPFDRLPGDIWLLLYLAWLGVGLFLIPGEKKTLLWRHGCNWPMWVIFAAVLLSCIPAYFYFGQSPLQSVLTSRGMLRYLAIPVLFALRPEERQIRDALYIFCALYLALALLDSILGIPLVDRTPVTATNFVRPYIAEDDFIHTYMGFQYFPMALIFAVRDFLDHKTWKNLAVVLIVFALIFLVQNRTSLFISAIILVLSIMTHRGGKKFLQVKLMVGLVLLLAAGFAATRIGALFTETVEDIGNDDYNRNLAYVYFLTEAVRGPLSVLFGNGFLSAGTTSLMQDMMEVGVYNSDVGFVGMWNQYGLVMVGLVICVCVMGLSRRMPMHVKWNAVYILASSISIAYFVESQCTLWLSIHIYMVFMNRSRTAEILIEGDAARE